MELQGQFDIFSTEQKPRMNVLIACEESQEVCKAFRERGHRAFSCDLQECSGGHPEWHIQGDCLSLINGNCSGHSKSNGRTMGVRKSKVYWNA